MRFLVLSVFLSMMSLPVLASDQLDVNFSNDTGKIGYSTPLRSEGYRQSRLNAGVLFNNDSDYIAEVGIRMTGDLGADAPGLSAGVGLDLIVGSVNDATAMALPLSVAINYRPTALPRLSIAGQLRFAPDVLAYVDIDQFKESSLRAGYELFPETSIYLGYRRLKVDLDKGGRVTADNGLHLGIRFSF